MAKYYIFSSQSSYSNINGKQKQEFKIKKEYCDEKNKCIKVYTTDLKNHYVTLINNSKEQKYIIRTEAIPETIKKIKDPKIQDFIKNYYQEIKSEKDKFKILDK
jgi:hypothetical protein